MFRLMLYAAMLTCFVAVAPVSAQEQDVQSDRPRQHEVSEGQYIPADRLSQQTSPAYRYDAAGFSIVQVNVNANGDNIVGDAANEPSIAMSAVDPNRMAIGWRQFNTITNNFRQAGYGYTTDGGASWTFPGVLEPGVFRSDPVLGSDSEGNFYYNSLTTATGDFTCDVFKTTNGGLSWDAGTFAHGGDKQWMAVDKSGGVGDGNIYSYWTSSYSSCFPNFFTRSIDDGASYQNCISIPNDPYWGTLSVGPDGELYVAGGQFIVAKSTTAKIDGQPVTWDFATTVSLDGTISSFSGNSSPNPGGLLGQVWIAVDHSTGPTRGYVYLLCSVDRLSNSDPLDVMFSRSTNGGVTWSAPVRINDDAGTNAFQWFGTMSVAPTGRIDVAWLDTRDNPGSVNSALYYSYSTDGGLTWAANEKLSASFDPHVGWPQQNKIGDYFDMVSDESGARLAWAATFNGEQDVYYSYITPEALPGIPCSEINRFQARCQPGGLIQARVVMNNTTHTGEVVTFAIDQIEYPVTIRSNGRAPLSVAGFGAGQHTVELVDPPGCFSPTIVNCSAGLSKGDDLWDEDDLMGTQASAAQLFENYPDPFNPSTTIRYLLPENAHVTLRVYNTLGQLVTTLVDAEQAAGYHEAVWDGRNESGGTVASGVYIYRFAAGDFTETRTMLLAK
jgi:hypothetical protein